MGTDRIVDAFVDALVMTLDARTPVIPGERIIWIELSVIDEIDILLRCPTFEVAAHNTAELFRAIVEPCGMIPTFDAIG